LDSNGKVIGEAKNYGLHNKEIDLKKQYKVGSSADKQQKLLKKTISNENRAIRETTKMKKISSATRRVTSKIASITKFGSRGVRLAKVGVMSATSAIPFVGVAAQIALDIYMAEQISDNIEETQKNREYIQRLQEEQEILGVSVDKNSKNIEELFQKIFNVDATISTIFTQMNSMNDIISENQKQIANIKNGIYLTAIGQLNDYFDSDKNDRDSLNNAINDFLIKSNIDTLNNDVNSLLINYLTIAYIEKALIYKRENRDFSFLKSKVMENFDNLIALGNIQIIANSYISMQEIFVDDISNLQLLNSKFKTVVKSNIENYIEKKLFEDALKLAKLYKSYTADRVFEEEVNRKREENFQRYKNQINSENFEKILAKNQNNLLTKEVIKVLYSEDFYVKMQKVLDTKKLDSRTFKIKAYYLLFQQIDSVKAEKLKDLILSNETYSLELKQYVQKH